jgi:predicted nucleic acid-binding protein
MVLVDTSIWIDFFRKPAGGEEKLGELIRGRNRVAICGIILQEILQGIKFQSSYDAIRQRLLFLPYLEAGRKVHLLAASLYRDLRSNGVTVPSADALISAVAIHHSFPLLSTDRHFAVIAANSPLQLYS